jgi:DNA/RNA endonuclease YhcR with UshA esterase domain
MKNFAIGLICLSFSWVGFAADAEKTNTTAKAEGPIKCTAADAKNHIGAKATVTGTVAEIHKTASVISLNFDEAYPKNVFAAAIFARNTNQFTEVDKLKGKTVEVTGTIKEYRNRTEIVLESTNQLKVIEKEAK